MSKLKPLIVHLEPMHVAWCQATGKEPEIKAFKMMVEWARQAEVEDADEARFFGFDNPVPLSDGREYGYEVWMMPKRDLRGHKGVTLKEFTGGRYAVTRTHLPQIALAWRELIAWRAESGYEKGAHQCLEEHLTLPLNNPPEAVEVDLYLPLAE